jgi:hypothetical protein
MVPIFRSLISIAAGVERMNVATFVLLTMVGSFIWNFIFARDRVEVSRQPLRQDEEIARPSTGCATWWSRRGGGSHIHAS